MSRTHILGPRYPRQFLIAAGYGMKPASPSLTGTVAPSTHARAPTPPCFPFKRVVLVIAACLCVRVWPGCICKGWPAQLLRQQCPTVLLRHCLACGF
eukprot:1157035-Pelagomonas_calceolata.AAC.1